MKKEVENNNNNNVRSKAHTLVLLSNSSSRQLVYLICGLRGMEHTSAFHSSRLLWLIEISLFRLDIFT